MAAAGGESCSLCSAVLCCVFSSSVSLLFLFPLFAVLLNCPYPHPPVSACFFPFSSAPRRGEGRQSGPMALLLPATAKLQQNGVDGNPPVPWWVCWGTG